MAAARGWAFEESKWTLGFPFLRWRLRAESVPFGSPSFVARVVDLTGAAIVGPPTDWFREFPTDLLGKRQSIERESLFRRSLSWQFVPWARQFIALVTVKKVESVVLWNRHCRARQIGPWSHLGTSSAPGIGTKNDPMTTDEETEVRLFVESVLQRSDIKLPPVFGLAVGAQDHGPMKIDEMFPICCTPFTAESAGELLVLLRRCIRPRKQLTPEERAWQLRSEGDIFFLRGGPWKD